jgi:hypothetical protein
MGRKKCIPEYSRETLRESTYYSPSFKRNPLHEDLLLCCTSRSRLSKSVGLKCTIARTLALLRISIFTQLIRNAPSSQLSVYRTSRMIGCSSQRYVSSTKRACSRPLYKSVRWRALTVSWVHGTTACIIIYLVRTLLVYSAPRGCLRLGNLLQLFAGRR